MKRRTFLKSGVLATGSIMVPIPLFAQESQAMMEAKRKAGNVVQVDFPRVMADINDRVKQYIESGAAGEIKGVKANIISGEGPLVEKDIPDTMDFETFCGPDPGST